MNGSNTGLRILGVDPGTRVSGFGLIDVQTGRFKHVENGGVFPPVKAPFHERIHHLFLKFAELIAEFQPNAVAIENIFVAKNVSSTLKLGHARGAIMVAACEAKLPVWEYSANEVKKAITGYGHASKEQIQRMVKSLLKLQDKAFTDASDALAVAICHANSYQMNEKVNALERLRAS